MISEGPSLIEALPGALQEALNAALEPGEPLRIAVRGAPREALAATDRRVLLLKEPLTGGAAAVERTEFPVVELAEVVLDSATGGSRLTLIQRGAGGPVVIEVPIYDHVKFGRVAERLNQLAASARHGGSPPPAEASGPSAVGTPAAATRSRGRCPKCSAVIPADGSYCPACGLQVADVCPGCGHVREQTWEYCPRCGLSANLPGIVPCPRCSEPVWPSQSFCTDCGTQVHARCAGCGGTLSSDWDYCAACGTPTGAEEASPAGAGDASLGIASPSPGTPAGRRNPEAEQLNAAGTEAYSNDQLDEAISLFQRAILRDPGAASYHTNLGVAYGEKGMDYEAYAAYRRALELDANEIQARLNLGYLYSERERYAQAREEWERVIATAPESEEAQEARENLNHLDEL